MRERWAVWAAFSLYALSLRAGEVAAEAPLGRYTVQTAIVRDNRTNLTWQRTLDGTMVTAAGAQSHCAGLQLEGGGFRLPTVHELRTILDVTRASPAIDPIAFPGTPPASFWTSTPYVVADDRGSNLIWYVDFGDGGSWGQPPTGMLRVRCVR